MRQSIFHFSFSSPLATTSNLLALPLTHNYLFSHHSSFICISFHFYYIFIFILINSTQSQQIVKAVGRMDTGDCSG